jgi:hypothetical protein
MYKIAAGIWQQAEQVIRNVDSENQLVLFHAGTADEDASINEQGVLAQMGEWVVECLMGATDSEECIQEIKERGGAAYFSETPGWIRSKVERAINKYEGSYRDCTLDDIRKYGQLTVVVAELDGPIKRYLGEDRGYNDPNVENLQGRGDVDTDLPFGVEPGDIFSESDVAVDITLVGYDLLEFMRRNYRKEYAKLIPDRPRFKGKSKIGKHSDELEEALTAVEGDLAQVQAVLAQTNADLALEYTGGKIYTVGDAVVAVTDDGTVTTWDDANEFLNGYNTEQYLPYDPDEQFNKDFWDSPSDLYHGTAAESVEAIMQNGLSPMNKTRGMSNRSTGSAIFTSTEWDEANYFYDTVLKIDTAAMKAELPLASLPIVGRESDIVEGEGKESLAHALGAEDYNYDYEQGISHSTVILYGSVAPKYLEVVKNGEEDPNKRWHLGSKTAASLVDSPQFKAWFNDSKVVDKQGDPLRCYHGTRSSVDFDEFSTSGPPLTDEDEFTSSGSGNDPTAFMGAHFSQETSVANRFALPNKGDWMNKRWDGAEEKPRVIPVYLAIKNPKDFGRERNLKWFIYQGKLDGYAGEELLNLAMVNADLDPENESTRVA